MKNKTFENVNGHRHLEVCVKLKQMHLLVRIFEEQLVILQPNKDEKNEEMNKTKMNIHIYRTSHHCGVLSAIFFSLISWFTFLINSIFKKIHIFLHIPVLSAALIIKMLIISCSREAHSRRNSPQNNRRNKRRKKMMKIWCMRVHVNEKI